VDVVEVLVVLPVFEVVDDGELGRVVFEHHLHRH
jgi:hypothetical protein